MKTMADIIGVENDEAVEQVRLLLSSACGKLEQAEMQRRKPTPIERRRMEWDAAKKIVNAVRAVDWSIKE